MIDQFFINVDPNSVTNLEIVNQELQSCGVTEKAQAILKAQQEEMSVSSSPDKARIPKESIIVNKRKEGVVKHPPP